MSYPLSTLPKTNQNYHVDSIGSLKINPYCKANHIIKIALSPIPNRLVNSPPDSLLRIFKTEHQKHVEISVGEFFGFPVGSFIRNGKILTRPTVANFSIPVNINDQTITKGVFPYSFLKPENENSFGFEAPLIPKPMLGFGADWRQPLIAIRRGNDPYSILISSTELIRFYQCSSSKLNKLLFSSAITDINNFVNKEKTIFSPEKKELKITLRREFPDEDAAIIGRWVACEKYYGSAHSAWNHLVKTRKNPDKNQLEIDADFPFQGKTILSGYGIKIPTPQKFNEQRILVMSLLGCTHPLPFEHLIVDRETPSPNTKEGPEEPGEDAANVPRKRRPPRSPKFNDSKEGSSDPYSVPSGYFDTKLFRIPANRFNPLKITKQHTTVYTPSKEVGGKPPEGTPSKYSTSDTATKESDSRQLSYVPTDEEQKNEPKKKHKTCVPANFDTFISVCKVLEGYSDIKEISEVDPNTSDNPIYSGVSEFHVPNPKAGPAWPKIYSNNEYSRPRQYMLKKIRISFYTYYLLYIEHKSQSDGPLEYYAFYIFRSKRNDILKKSFIQSLFDELSRKSFKGYRKEFSDWGMFVTSVKRKPEHKTIGNSILMTLKDEKWQSVIKE